MSSPLDSSLEQFLQQFQTQGETSDPGHFTLDPERAVAMLRAQGRLSQSGPLPLLSALYSHTQGGPVALDRALWRLSWPAELGPLRPSFALLLGEASLAAQGIKLGLHKDHVRLSARGGPEAIEAVFSPFWRRLVHYPWEKPFAPVPTPLFSAVEGDLTIDYYPPPAVDPFGVIARPTGRFIQVLQGVSYPRKWPLPLDAVIKDELSRADFSMTVVPSSERRRSLEAAAERLFRVRLRAEALALAPLELDPDSDDIASLPLLARFAGYAVAQSQDLELARLSGDNLFVRDATGHRWSLRQLWEHYQGQGRILVVEAAHGSHLELPRPERPVLRWTGQISHILSPLLLKKAPGDGYLYTLAVNEAERQRLAAGRGERRLSRLTRDGESWSLLPWGDPDRPAELEFVGPRRARETYYLDPSAPKGLRLLWESSAPLDRATRELALDAKTRLLVLDLISSSMKRHPPPRESVLAALQWAEGLTVEELSGLVEIDRAPLLELIDGDYTSLQECRRRSEQREALPVLADRSTSIPAAPPLSFVLWDHPVLHRLGLPTREVGREFRESYWKEVGKERWLAAHQPGEPNWPAEPWTVVEGHRVARAREPAEATRVVFWRQGRPFGSITLDPESCRSGFQVLWVEDDLPGDIYWSGPELAAILKRIPRIDELCAQATKVCPEDS